MNAEILRFLNDLKVENSGNKHRVIAYCKIISTIKMLTFEITDKTDLTKIKGIGAKTQEKIRDFINSKDTISDGIAGHPKANDDDTTFYNELMSVTGVGHVKAMSIITKGYKSIDDDFHHLLNDKQRIGIKYYKSDAVRIPRTEIDDHDKYISEKIAMISGAEYRIVGSYRRGKNDSGDIDLIITHNNYNILNEVLKNLGCSYLLDNFAHGEKKFMGWCRICEGAMPRRIDILFTKKDEYPFALMYFTGSNTFNKRLRSMMLRKGMRLNEYGLYKVGPDKQLTPIPHTFNTERDIFEYSNIEYLEPCDREAENIIIK